MASQEKVKTQAKPHTLQTSELWEMYETLERMSERLKLCYPDAFSGDREDPIAEAARNIATAVTQVEMWIAARSQSGRDPT